MQCRDIDNKTRNYYCYYDTPDGCDIQKKAMVTAKYGAITGIILGTHDVMMYSHAIGLGPILRRYMLHTVPLTLMGATFAVVANGVHNLRQQDDELNYFLGGLACGPIAGYYLGSYHAVFLGGLALGIAGVVKKMGIDCDYRFFPNVRQHMGTIRSWRNDYTFSQDPRDNMIHSCGEKNQ